MNMPGFTAGLSAYKTRNPYRLATSGSFQHDGEASVVPQDCGLFEEVVCGGLIVEGALLCAGLCVAGPEACIACWAAALGYAYSLCKDCIPRSSGGGGGSPSCCPIGATCRCGGKCVPGRGCIGGTCLRPNQECP